MSVIIDNDDTARKQQILSIQNFSETQKFDSSSKPNQHTNNTPTTEQSQVTNKTINTPQMEILTTPPDNRDNSSLLEGGGDTINLNIKDEDDDGVAESVSEENIKVDNSEVNDEDEDEDDEDDETQEKSKDISDGDADGDAGDNIKDDIEHVGGSDDRTYEIDYLVEDDKELISIEKVNSIVNKYVNNFYSEEMKKYKQAFKQLYQKYSNKRFIINNIGNVITVMKNEKKKVVVLELKKPLYFYYNNNDNLEILKRNISNERANLQYLYQVLVNKLNVENDEKKDFEKKRKKFIELLETYYIYALYHKKINKISMENKMNIIMQDLLSESKILEGNIYSIENSTIDLINKNNASKLNEFNNLVSKMQSVKKVKDEKTLIEKIKEYLNKLEADKLMNSLKEQAKYQEQYIEYIVKELP
jgi:hypothetical protein